MNASINGLSPQQLRRAADLKEKIESLQSELNQLLGSKGATPSSGGKRTLSASARARIVAAQKARWAKFHAAKGKKK